MCPLKVYRYALSQPVLPQVDHLVQQVILLRLHFLCEAHLNHLAALLFLTEQFYLERLYFQFVAQLLTFLSQLTLNFLLKAPCHMLLPYDKVHHVWKWLFLSLLLAPIYLLIDCIASHLSALMGI